MCIFFYTMACIIVNAMYNDYNMSMLILLINAFQMVFWFTGDKKIITIGSMFKILSTVFIYNFEIHVIIINT